MDVLVPIVFPDYKISALGTTWSSLGHAGILLVLGSTGTTKYYEYGRYDKAAVGLVRKRDVPNARILDGKIDQQSLSMALHEIALKAGHATRIEGAYIEQDGGYPKALAAIQARLDTNKDANRKSYGLLMNNCADFMKQALEAAGVDVPWMIDPRPNSYIAELRSDFPSLDYDPGSKTLVIGAKP